MKYLKRYKLFENIDVKSICEKFGIENYTINSDGSIDVDGDVDLFDRNLTKIPLKFRNVSGHFWCSHNQLTTLEGAPESVGDDFWCYNNQLTTLEGSPESVGRDFLCNNNQLTTLEGSPESVGVDFLCNNNQLTTLEGYPKSVGRDFLCDNNPVYEIWKLFKDYSKIELLNDYDFLRQVDGKPSVIIDRLNDFLKEIGKPPIEKVNGWVNI